MVFMLNDLQQTDLISKNPYESPTDDLSHRNEEPAKASWFDMVYLPMIWGVGLFLLFVVWGLSSGNDMPQSLKLASTVLTLAALATMVVCIRGWKLLITAPLWAHLIWVQYLVWTFYSRS